MLFDNGAGEEALAYRSFYIEKRLKEDPIIFALANPTPEIHPDQANEAGALIVATGRSDFPNQVNNSLVFPGVFRGALDVRARAINEPMKIEGDSEIIAQRTRAFIYEGGIGVCRDEEFRLESGR